MTSSEDYEFKTILITGGAGFIGSETVRQFADNYPERKIIVVDCIDYCATERNFEELIGKPNFVFAKGDIQNQEFIFALLQAYNVDSIINFAAQSHVDLSFKNSLDFTRTNVVGTHVLLECGRKHGIKRFIHVSTDEVYGDVTNAACESTSHDPTNPYAFSKAAAELVVKSYIKNFGFPVIITRGNNVYGHSQFPEKVIPKFILRLLNNQKCCLHGEGTAKRTYVHVSDVARAFDCILRKGKDHEIYNIGSEVEINMKELALKLISLIHKVEGEEADQYLEYVEDRNINDQRYWITVEKLKTLGWKAEHDFESGLASTIEWYKKMPPDWWPDFMYALAPHPSTHKAT